MKLLLNLSAAVGLLLLSESCTESKGDNPPIPKTSEAIPVKVMKLTKSAQQLTIQTSGQITTDNEILLSFKVGGVVKDVLVEEGSQIRKGQTLAVLDMTEVTSMVTQAQSAAEKTERDLNRVKNLYADSVATLEQLQNAQTAFDIARAQLNTATFNRGLASIKASADGYVLKKFVSAGQLVNPGDPVLRTNDAIEGKWILRAGVSDRQWAAIRDGDPATISLDAFPGKQFAGSVLRKSGSSDPNSGAFTVEIEIDGKGNRFASGMFAAASIATRSNASGWHVPYDAVLDADGNAAFVFVTDDNETARRVPVTIGSFDEQGIRVVEGLEESGALIISGSAYLQDQSRISVIQ